MAQDLEQLVLTISADTRQMQRALAKLTGDTAAAAKSVDNAFSKAGGGRGLDAAAKGVKSVGKAAVESGQLARYELINLSRQLQDVGVSLAGGQSPFTVLVQQGTQIADIFGSSGTATVGGAIKQIGSGIAGVITPMRLLGVGVAATGIAAYAAYGNWKSFTLQLDDTARIVGTTTGSLSKLQAAAAFKGIDGADFNKGIQAFGQNVYEAQNNMGSLAEAFRANNTHAKTFDEYLERAADLIQRAGSTQKQLSLLQQMGLPATMEWVKLLSGGADGLNKAKNAAAEFAANDDMVKKAREFDEAWNKAWTNFGLNARSAFQSALSAGLSLFDRMEKLAQSAGNANFWKGLYSEKSVAASGVTLLSGFDARFSGDSKNPVSPNGALADALSKRAAALSAGPPTMDPNVLKDQISKGQQYLGLLGQTITATEARRQVELQLQAAALNGVTIDGKRAEVLKKLAEENVLGITAMKQQADSLRVEAATLGMGVGQASAYAAAQNALNEARRNGRALTQDNIAAINAEAAVLGKAAQAAAQLRLASDIKFDRSQIGLSDSEANTNSRIRSIFGDDATSAQAQFYKQQLMLNDALRQYSDVSKDANKGFISDIIAGKNALESLSGALTKIGNKLLDMAVDGLWGKAFGGGGGLGLLSSLFGGGSSGTIQVGNQLFPKFANGTMSAPGGLAIVGERGPELVNLPAGSQVIPNNALNRTMLSANDNAAMRVAVGGSTVVIQGDASEKTVALINQALARHDAELPSKVINTVRKAQQGRSL